MQTNMFQVLTNEAQGTYLSPTLFDREPENEVEVTLGAHVLPERPTVVSGSAKISVVKQALVMDRVYALESFCPGRGAAIL